MSLLTPVTALYRLKLVALLIADAMLIFRVFVRRKYALCVSLGNDI